ncbi:MAG: hypothetical protein K2X27_18850 [Candidatus Obscuribacterales bacterium]|nr:hypothetical protein [Candidatus Obscuribacterales bacterium]
MNIKSLTTAGLAIMLLAFAGAAPSQARDNNNNKALNQLAMQYYLQQQQAQANGTAGIYNPLLSNAPILSGAAYSNGGSCGFHNNASYNGYNHLQQEIANINARLSTANLPPWELSRLNNKLAKLQARQAAYANVGYNAYGNGYGNVYGNGYGNVYGNNYGNPYSYQNPYNYNGSGLLNNVRSYFGF